MATIAEIDAQSHGIEPPKQVDKLPKRFIFGVFFDGTGNNMIQPQRAAALRNKVSKKQGSSNSSKYNSMEGDNDLFSSNGANSIDDEKVVDPESDYSNIAALHNFYCGMSKMEREALSRSEEIHIYNVYVEGAGTEEKYSGSFVQKAHNWRGSGLGRGHTGVPVLVGKAMELVQQKINGFKIEKEDKVIFDVFGFSRGSACARMFSHLIGTQEILKCDKDFPKLVQKLRFLKQFDHKKRSVAFLGIFDTVSSIGWKYDNNTTEYGMYSPNEDWVEATLHITALDEYRDHFRLTDAGNAITKNALEIFMPGCHSDIGGGYKSGVQNIAIQYNMERNWIVSAKSTIGMALGAPSSTSTPIRRQIINYSPCNGGTSLQMHAIGEITLQSLESIGWYSTEPKDGYQVFDDRVNSIYNIKRPIERGYSNITLQLMYDRAIKKTKRSCFIPTKTSRFCIYPEDLEKIRREMKNWIRTKESGRYFYIPLNVAAIRKKYIHYSASDALMFKGKNTSIVHTPTLDGRTVTRIIYHGDKGDSQTHYMYQYR